MNKLIHLNCFITFKIVHFFIGVYDLRFLTASFFLGEVNSLALGSFAVFICLNYLMFNIGFIYQNRFSLFYINIA